MQNLALTYFVSLTFAYFNLAVFLQSISQAQDIADAIIGPLGGIVISVLFGYLIYTRWNEKEKEIAKFKDDLIKKQENEISELRLKLDELNKEIQNRNCKNP